MVSEVTGNAVRHARGPVWVSMSWREVYPRLTVRDLGPGFDVATIGTDHARDDGADAGGTDADGIPESGRGFMLVSSLASELQATTRAGGGAEVSVVLPVSRKPSVDHDPPRTTIGALPDQSETDTQGNFGKEAFLRALVVQLARTVEFQHGPDAADAAVAQVGTDVGAQMEQAFRVAERVTDALTPEQMARCFVRLKHAIDGGFSVQRADEGGIVLTNTRCPFGDAVRLAPALCRMTSSVFGGIAARNRGSSVAVPLEEQIAVGDPGCRVVIAFDDSMDVDVAAAHVYAPPAPASEVRRRSPSE